MISVNMVDANVYQVIVEGQAAQDGESSHRVRMSQEYYRELCGATVTHEFVLIQAFRFLLDRGPNSAIAAEFDLHDLNRVYPEFEAELKARFS